MTNWQYEHLRFEKIGTRFVIISICYPSRDGAWLNWSIDKLGLEGVDAC